MTITDAKAYTGLVAGATPAGTNVGNNVLVGEGQTTTSWTGADLAYSFKVTATGAGDVATLTLASGTVAQTTGTPTISPDLTSGGLDFEGNSLSTLVTVYGIYVTATTVTTSIDVAGTLGVAGKLYAAGDTLQIKHTASTTLGTVTLTLTTSADVAEVVIIGKTS